MIRTPTDTDPKFCQKDFALLSLVGLSGSMIVPLLFLNGLNQTTALNTSLLQNAESLFTVLIAMIFLKERCTKQDWFGISFLIIGAIILATNAQFSELSLGQWPVGNF